MFGILQGVDVSPTESLKNQIFPISNQIDKLFAENKLPIVVGGTNYYIESLLWHILIEKPGDTRKTLPWEYRKKNPDVSSEELHEKLKVLDPEMATRLHPNNKRKIIRFSG